MYKQQGMIIHDKEDLEEKFETMVSRLVKPGQDILDTITPQKMDALHMAVGVAGEAGEVLDEIKKIVMYNRPVTTEKIVKELGDLEFYMEGLRQKLGITREETLIGNIEKLDGDRYKDGYSDDAANARTDVNTGEK